MRIIPVLDLLAGQVVRGIGGRRSEYRPVISCLTSNSAPLHVAQALIQNFAPAEFYIADLDAIAGNEPAWAVYESLRGLGVHLWIDRGVREATDATALAAAGIHGVVCGLETLRGPDVLGEVLAAIGPERTIFSLDLRDGCLMGNRQAWSVRDSGDALAVVEAVVAQGVRRLIILDLARVGEGRGTGSEVLCRSIADAYPELEVFVGGGVRGLNDLAELERAGAAGVLVASALHDGRIAPIRAKPPAIS